MVRCQMRAEQIRATGKYNRSFFRSDQRNNDRRRMDGQTDSSRSIEHFLSAVVVIIVYLPFARLPTTHSIYMLVQLVKAAAYKICCRVTTSRGITIRHITKRWRGQHYLLTSSLGCLLSTSQPGKHPARPIKFPTGCDWLSIGEVFQF